MVDHDETKLTDYGATFQALERELSKVVLGQEDTIRFVLVSLFAGGHVLLEGPPGIGKTLLARSLSRVLGVEFKRIQFTPDLMPSDVVGGNIFNQRVDDFVFRPGPVFTQVLLADEVNRAPAKTQSALLEAMGDAQVTVDGETRGLPAPFFTLATQNPIESEGTYPLPEAQLDRFLMKLLVDHPAIEVEVQLLMNTIAGFDASQLDAADLSVLLDGEGILKLRQYARTIRVDPEICDYIARVVQRTRSHPAVDLGASPRASLALLRCAQVLAMAEGRDYVTPDDIKELAKPILRHRFLLQPDAELEGIAPDEVVRQILMDVPVPGGEEG